MVPALQDVCRASIPKSALGVLAGVRCLPDLRVTLDGDRAWVDWRRGHDQVLLRLLPVPGLELYTRRENRWFRHGCALPAGPLPEECLGEPLAAVLAPGLVAAEQPPAARSLSACRMRLERDTSSRETSAMLCDLPALGRWVESASTLQISSLLAARCGQRLLLRGRELPLLPDSGRFWGERLLVPLGFHVWPGLPETVLLEAAGVGVENLLLLGERSGEVIPLSVFAALSRATVRWACKENR